MRCHKDPGISLIPGDAAEVLHAMPKDTIDLTFSSIPSDPELIGPDREHHTYSDYLEYLAEVVFQIYSLTKEGRFLVLNSRPMLEPRADRQHESRRYGLPFDLHSIITSHDDWMFIDDIVWVKPEQNVAPRNSSWSQHRKPLAWKPNVRTEYLMVYRKKTDRLIDWNLRRAHQGLVLSSVIKEGKDDFGHTAPTSNVWEMPPIREPDFPNALPPRLVSDVIRLYSVRGDVVLDPFAHIGGTGGCARALHRSSVLIEKNARFIQRMKAQFGRDIEATAKKPFRKACGDDCCCLSCLNITNPIVRKVTHEYDPPHSRRVRHRRVRETVERERPVQPSGELRGGSD